MKTFSEKFFEVFDNLGNSELLTIYNEWAYETGNEPIYFMEEFDDLMAGFSPSDIALKVYHGNFRPYVDYFTFDGYANLESIENVAEYIDDYDCDLCQWYEEHQERLADLLDEWGDEEEE